MYSTCVHQNLARRHACNGLSAVLQATQTQHMVHTSCIRAGKLCEDRKLCYRIHRIVTVVDEEVGLTTRDQCSARDTHRKYTPAWPLGATAGEKFYSLHRGFHIVAAGSIAYDGRGLQLATEETECTGKL